jgi:hypothetical protein
VNRTVRFLAALCGLALVGGCKPTPVLTPGPTPSIGTRGLPGSGARQAGMELLTWQVDETEELDGWLAMHGAPALGEGDDGQLNANATRLLRIPEAELPDLLERIGGINASMSTWCGQVTDWRPLRDIRFKRHILAVDDQTTILDGGRLSWSARAWVEPTLESARMHVELVPMFQADRGTYSSLLIRERPKILTFDRLAKTTDLEPGEVLLMTCSAPPGPPEAPAPFIGPPIGEDPDPDDDPTLDRPIPGPDGRIAGSLEIGHALFSLPGEAPERIILILVPRMPDAIMPNSPAIPEHRISLGEEATR